ncbi:MAG: ABC transporter permease [Desulfurococcales archaeon]|nr:ABC transporter permease [Desulfurococcales archaeon]
MSITSLVDYLKARKTEYITGAMEVTLSAITGFFIAGIILQSMGYNALSIFNIMITGGVSDLSHLAGKSAPLVMTGLAFSIPLMAGVFNIGGESQLYMGALAGLVGTYYSGNILIGLVLGFLAGAFWGWLMAALRVYRGINEVITAIMLNWTAYYFIIYLIIKYLPNPEKPYMSIQLPQSEMLSMNTTFLLSVLGALAAYYIIYYTDLGYKMRVSGFNPKTAQYSGFDPSKSILFSMALGGGLAGFGGALLVIGVSSGIDTTMTSLYGLGFTGIGVGLLGRNHPIGIIFSSLFFADLIIGGQWVELETGAPPYVSDTIIGIIVIALSAPYAYKKLVELYRLRRR